MKQRRLLCFVIVALLAMMFSIIIVEAATNTCTQTYPDRECRVPKSGESCISNKCLAEPNNVKCCPKITTPPAADCTTADCSKCTDPAKKTECVNKKKAEDCKAGKIDCTQCGDSRADCEKSKAGDGQPKLCGDTDSCGVTEESIPRPGATNPDDEILVQTFIPPCTGTNDIEGCGKTRYATAPDGTLFMCENTNPDGSCEGGYKSADQATADRFNTNYHGSDLTDALGEGSKMRQWKNSFWKPLCPIEGAAAEHWWVIGGCARNIGNSFYDMLVKWKWLDKGFLFGDAFQPLLNFYSTEFGQIVGGDWENSICAVTTDYENAAGEGFAFTPGSTSPGAWINVEAYYVPHPNPSNPAEMVTDKFYTISYSVNAAGLTEVSGENCEGRVKFYIGLDNNHLDVNGNGVFDDTYSLTCDDSISVTGSGAYVLNTTYGLSKACIHFTDTGSLHPAFKEQLEGGNGICKRVTMVGESPDIADCGFYCGLAGDLGGIDLNLNLNLGGGGGGGDEGESHVPAPPAGGQPGIV